MNFRHALKKTHFFSSCFSKICCAATLISPTLNTQLRYFSVFGKFANLKSPQSLNEKLLWLKLNRYNHDPLVFQCADKYKVREYVESCGYGHMLNKLIAVYEKAEDINWKKLPSRFVLKWNFGASMNIICPDKAKLDSTDAVRKLDKWSRRKVWLNYSEMQYKYSPKRIVCEEFLEDDVHKSLPDYKVYCFHGKPMATLVMTDRSTSVRASFYDNNWQLMEGFNKYPPAEFEKPACFDAIMEAAEKLSQPFPFVRCDFYIVNGKPYFGELTFTPAGGLYTAQTKINSKNMTDYLMVP